MSLTRSESRQIAARYVDAAFTLALSQGKQDELGAQLSALKATIDASDDLRKLIVNPLVSVENMSKAFTEIASRLKCGDLARGLIRTVIENRRESTLPDVAEIYAERLAEHYGEMSAEVTTAKPLSASQRKKIEAALKKAAGKDVAITTQEDASIIGGMIIRMGTRMLDRSVAGKLQRLKANLTSAAI